MENRLSMEARHSLRLTYVGFSPCACSKRQPSYAPEIDEHVDAVPMVQAESVLAAAALHEAVLLGVPVDGR